MYHLRSKQGFLTVNDTFQGVVCSLFTYVKGKFLLNYMYSLGYRNRVYNRCLSASERLVDCYRLFV